MGKTVTRLWIVAGVVLAGLVVAGVVVVLVLWGVGLSRNDEDLVYHGTASIMTLTVYLPWFLTHYWLRPTLTGLLLPFVGVLLAPCLFVLLLLFTMETPGVTVHLRTIVFWTMFLAPVAGMVWFVARCRRGWARLLAQADALPGGRVVVLAEVVRYAQWTGVCLVDVRSDAFERGYLWGRYREGEVCVVDDARRVVDRASPVVRFLGRSRSRATTHYVTAPA